MRVNGRTFYAIWRDSLERDIVLWGDSRSDCSFLKERMKLLDVDVWRSFVGDGAEEDLACALSGRTGQCLVVILKEDYDLAKQALERIGMRKGLDFKWIKRYGVDDLDARYAFDPVLGFNSIGDAGSPGFSVVGDSGDPSLKRVVILGGSSTDPSVFPFKSWPEFLYDELCADGIPSCIFNGAVTGYTSSQELIKLIRDVMALRPDLVISFSGINNNHLVRGYPFMTDYNLKLSRYFEFNKAPTVNIRDLSDFNCVRWDAASFDRYSFWLNEEKVMERWCSLYGVKFLCFLQPNLMSKDVEKLLSEEREYLLNRSFMGRIGMTPAEYRKVTLGFRELVQRESAACNWLHDLSDIFDRDCQSVYLDGIHVNEIGNRETAAAIAPYVVKVFDGEN